MEKQVSLSTIEPNTIIEFLNDVDAEKLCKIVKVLSVPILCAMFGDRLINLANKAIDQGYSIDFDLLQGRFEMANH